MLGIQDLFSFLTAEKATEIQNVKPSLWNFIIRRKILEMQNSFSFICETVVSAETPFLELQKCLPAATSLDGGKSMEMMENQCVISDSFISMISRLLFDPRDSTCPPPWNQYSSCLMTDLVFLNLDLLERNTWPNMILTILLVFFACEYLSVYYICQHPDPRDLHYFYPPLLDFDPVLILIICTTYSIAPLRIKIEGLLVILS